MSKDLEKLLRSYEFLNAALEKKSISMTSGDAIALRRERASIFKSLLMQSAGDPRIAAVQLRAIVECMASTSKDSELATLLLSAFTRHLDSLVPANAPIADPPPRQEDATLALGTPLSTSGRPDPAQARMLDHLSDRVILISRDYHYLFANAANCKFHRQEPPYFVDRPLWITTSEKFFERVNKPMIDKCFAGIPTSYSTSHPGRDPGVIYSCQLDPIFDQKGQIVAALGSARAMSKPHKALVCPRGRGLN